VAKLLPGDVTLVDVSDYRLDQAGDDASLLRPASIDTVALQAHIERLRARRSVRGRRRQPEGRATRVRLPANPYVLLYGAFSLADAGVRGLLDLSVYVGLERRESVRRVHRLVSHTYPGLRGRLEVSRRIVPDLFAQSEEGYRCAHVHLSGDRPPAELSQVVARRLGALLAG
jgi:hypothetical protein